MSDLSDPGEPRPLRVVRRRAQADEWALVLTAEGLQASVHGSPDGFVLAVPDDQREAAEHALASFERENRRPPPTPELPPIDRDAPQHALLLGAVLLASFAITGPDGGALAERAAADAGAIRDGAWWRAVTALGLHADAGHVLGNAVAAALFGSAVFRAFGAGVGGALVLAAGGFGNAANALLRAEAHSTIGASTAVFGALGIAVGERMARRRASPSRQSAWIPLAAGLALLAMLGTEGERVDVWAHGFGFGVGIALGLAATAVPSRWLARPAMQAAIGLIAVLVLCGAWILALRS